MKIVVFLADGFEEVEALTVVDYLRRMDIEVDTVSIGEEREVKGAHNIRVIADKTMAELDGLDTYSGVVIPGGLPGATNLRDDERVIDTVKTLYEKDKLVAAICAGPVVLERAGIIKGKKITSYPGFEKELEGAKYQASPIVVDGNIITARGPYYAVNFAISIIDYLLGKEKAEELKEDILYNEILEG